MKFNVSVPDDLWSAALSVSTVGDSPSAVIQDALRKVAAPVDRTLELDEEATELLEAARETVLESAQREYTLGYKYGLRLAQAIGDWNELRKVAEVGVVAAYHAALADVKAQLADGSYPRSGKKNVFVFDSRTDESTLESGEDEDGGEWFINHDPMGFWLHRFMIDEDGRSLTYGGLGDHPLLNRGTDAALRDVLAQSTPR